MSPHPDRDRREHEEFRLLAAAAVDGRLDADSASALEEHLRGCAECRADQRAMVEDHVWLATPRRLDPPSPQVREFVLEAARSHRIPRTSSTDRPWAAFAAAALVIAVLGGGVLLALRPTSSGSGLATSTPRPTVGQSSVAGGTCVPIPSGLSARWHFDSNVEYFTGQPIEFMGAVEHAPGIASSALHLTAGTNAAVANPSNLDFGTADFTMSLWVRFASTEGEHVLVERWAEDPLEGWTLTKANNRLRFAVATAAGEFAAETDDIEPVPGPWHHIAVRREGNAFTLFFDGSQAPVGNLDPGVRADLSTDLPLLFGRRGDERTFALDGDLDEFVVWAGRALDDTEIAALRRAGDDGFCEAAAGIGYEGSWATVDCATAGLTVECDRWGDAGRLQLTIGPGEQPAVRFEDDEVDGCGGGGVTGPRLASGTGHFEGVYLWVAFDQVDCLSQSESWTNPMQLYKAFGDPGIWFDPDGDEWGLAYRPA